MLRLILIGPLESMGYISVSTLPYTRRPGHRRIRPRPFLPLRFFRALLPGGP